MDLRKVFDLLDHCLLLQHLFNLGISWVELTRFTDYLTQRLQCGKCRAKFSDWGPVLDGIPQGSALEPLLFLILYKEWYYAIASQTQLFVTICGYTCLICCGQSPTLVSPLLMLMYIYCLIGSEIVKCNLISKGLVSVLWFSTKLCNAVVQAQVI